MLQRLVLFSFFLTADEPLGLNELYVGVYKTVDEDEALSRCRHFSAGFSETAFRKRFWCALEGAC